MKRIVYWISAVLVYFVTGPDWAAWAESPVGRLGDRLIVSVNNLPYTQRQIEAYATVREALRSGSVSDGVVVASGNWKDAVDMFTEEMIILQEAQRLGGFQAESRLTSKFQSLLSERLQANSSLRTTLERLGYHAKSSRRLVDAILRVATFRRSKERQLNAQVSDKSVTNKTDGPPAPAGAPVNAGGPWLDDLKARTIVRHYEEAFRYVMIYPTQSPQNNAR